MTEREARPRKVLVADADPGRRASVARQVRAAGFEALEARDGPDALRLLRAGAADAALLDSQLPGMGWPVVLEQTGRGPRAVPVVLLASPGSIREAVLAMQHGARNYLTRPLTGPDLAEALREALRAPLAPPPVPAAASDEQARQAQKMEAVGRLAGGVAHDFNNFLTVVSGHAEILRVNTPPDHPLRSSIEEIQRAVDRVASVTRQLLAFSRKQVLQPTVLDLNQVVVRIERLLRPLIGEHVELRLQLALGPCPVKADPGQLEQVIVNLAVNARDAMPAGGTLTIATDHSVGGVAAGGDAPPGRWVVLSVRDTGCGMDEATQAHIFEPFFTTKGPGQGTGLGLATVHGIVEQARGHIAVESDLGCGATFTIYLPEAQEPVRAAESSPGPSPLPRGTETILLLEDEEAVRGLVRRILEMQGYSVLEAHDGEHAQNLAVVHPSAIHLLITDVVMPRMSGCDVARALARIRPEMRVLYISGYTNSPLLQRTLAETKASALAKPFAAGPLARKVREVLDGMK
jgi:signal transduction histidine kinase